MTNEKNIGGFVLAGGKSSRIGRDKSLLECGGETLLARAVRAVSTVGENPVRIVLKKDQSETRAHFPPNAAALEDANDFANPLAGLAAVFHYCFSQKIEFAAVLAVDLPFMTSRTIEKLAAIAAASTEFAAVVPRQIDGRPQPLCAVYHAEKCLDAIERLIKTDENASLRDFLALVPTLYIEQNQLSSDENLFFNVNRVEDFEAARKMSNAQ